MNSPATFFLNRSTMPSRRPRGGFSLGEALASLAVTVIAGAALLLSVNSNVQLTEHTERRVIAQGMARQLMDEVLGTRYMALGATPYQTAFTASEWELVPGTRERYDDIDDYDAWYTRPPVDEYGVWLGTEDGQGAQRDTAFRAPSGTFERWQQQISITYADPDDLTKSLPSGQTSDFRAVVVRIMYIDPERGPIELARIRRIVSYVPAVESSEP